MIDFEFNAELIQFFLEHRTPLATVFFQLFTALGEMEGYILVVASIYAAFDKRLAIRLAILALGTMCINHLMKTIIANPRPFVAEGSFEQNWAISKARAAELATEYSTPSGHAMAGASFYGFLYASVTRRWVRLLAVAAILFTGVSRPYLGVHYVEDIVLGWPLGLALALVALRYGGSVGKWWFGLTLSKQGLIVVLFSVAVVLGTSPLYSDTPHGPPLAFISYLGLLSGLSMAHPLEIRWVDFDPRSSTPFVKLARVGLGVVLVMATLLALDSLFAQLAADGSVLGNILRYLRYAAAGFVGMLAAPYLYVRLGWAKTVKSG